jgi:hypothetical protein
MEQKYQIHTSHVVAPKCIPDDAAWHTAHGISLKISSIFGFELSSKYFTIQLNRKNNNEVTSDFHADGNTF